VTATLFGILALVVGGGLMALSGLLRLRLARRAWFAWLPLALLAGTALAAWLDGFVLPAAALAGLAGAWLVLVGQPLWRAALALQARVQARPRIAWTLLLAASPAIAWCWADAVLPEFEPLEVPSIMAISTSEVEPCPCRTDAGRPIKVFVPQRDATADEVAAVEIQTQNVNAIHRDPAGAYYNCHGWVFTGGRYWVSGEQVPDILEDNGYAIVSQPRPGDVIVYRTGDKVVHTGIVRAADEFGVLVESKWGKRGRFIHPPETQDYSADFAYYRSPRTGHLLLGPDAVSSPSAPLSVSRPLATQ
jgi:hypothetical protein